MLLALIGVTLTGVECFAPALLATRPVILVPTLDFLPVLAGTGITVEVHSDLDFDH